MSKCSCVTDALVAFNSKVEQGFYKLGGLIATYPLITITSVCLFFGGFGFGLLKATSQDDIYQLWIESNSRLHPERDFDAAHFPFSTRQQFMMATSADGKSLGTPSGLADWLRLTETLGDVYVNYTGSRGGTFDGTNQYGWEDVCWRYSTPLLLRSIFSVSGNKEAVPGPWAATPRMRGFPCARYTAIDCFYQGGYDNEIYPPVSPLLIEPSYLSKPNMTALNEAQLLEVLSPSCSNWGGSFFPWNFLYGSPQRVDPNNDTSLLTYIGSFRLLISTKSIAEFAEVTKKEKCIAKAEQAQIAQGKNRRNPTGEPIPKPGNCGIDSASCFSYVGLAKNYPQMNSSNPWWQVDCQAQGDACKAGVLGVAVPKCAGICVTAGTGTFPQSAFDCQTALTNMFVENLDPLNIANWPTCIQQGLGVDPAGVAANFTQVLLQGNSSVNVCKAQGDQCGFDFGTYCLGFTSGCWANDLAGCVDEPDAIEMDDAENIVLAWEEAFLNHMGQLHAAAVNGEFGFEVDYYAERSTTDLVNEAGSASASLIIIGYACMFLYTGLSFIDCNPLESRFLAGFFGVFICIISVVACLGITCLTGTPMTPTIVQVLPFVGLGLGVDGVFVLGGTYKYRPGWSYAEMGGAMLAYAGPSVSLTNMTNFFAFLVGYFVPLPVISQFALAAMIGVACNYFLIIFGFTAILTLDAKRIRHNRMDCFCCFRTKMDERDIKPNEGNTQGVWRKFADVVLSIPGKVIIILLSIAGLVIAIIGATKLEVGLPLADIVPTDHYSSGFLHQLETNYGAFSAGLVIGMAPGGAFVQLDYTDPNVLDQILNTERQLEHVYGYSYALPMRSYSGLDAFLIYITDPDNSIPASYLHPTRTYTLPFYNEEYPEQVLRYPLPPYFNSLLNQWMNFPGSGTALSNQFELDAITGGIKSLRLGFFEERLFTLPDIVQHIDDTRYITDNSGLPCFPAGFVFDLYEQYLNVSKYMSSHLGYVAIAMILCLFTFLYNPLAVFLLVGVLVIMVVEIYGYLYWGNLKLNGVSVVNVIMGTGISIEFTVHFVRFFMVFLGTRDERANQSLRLMAFPVFSGGVTTLIGILPMAFAKFPYFKLYFFYQYLIILIVGWWNGIFLLPVLLSLFGPSSLSIGTDKATEKKETM